MAGMEGFEPPNASTKNWCLTTWRHPNTLEEYSILDNVFARACHQREEVNEEA